MIISVLKLSYKNKRNISEIFYFHNHTKKIYKTHEKKNVVNRSALLEDRNKNKEMRLFFLT